MILSLDNLDPSKYKRVFILGCSFTQYYWPTWADIIVSEIPDANVYNTALMGTGNFHQLWWLQMLSKVAELTESDLVLQCFSTFCREDRILSDHTWSREGEIHAGSCAELYDDAYVEKYFFKEGFVLRDFANIISCVDLHNTAPWDSVVLQSTPLTIFDEFYTPATLLKNKISLYFNEFISYNQSLKDSIGGAWPQPGLEKLYFVDGDPHPGPIDYFNWLVSAGLNATSLSHEMLQYNICNEYQLMKKFCDCTISNEEKENFQEPEHTKRFKNIYLEDLYNARKNSFS